jgi:hypothetical protein
MTLGLKKPMRVMALVNHRHSLAVATERADLRRVDGQCPVGVMNVDFDPSELRPLYPR